MDKYKIKEPNWFQDKNTGATTCLAMSVNPETNRIYVVVSTEIPLMRLEEIDESVKLEVSKQLAETAEFIMQNKKDIY